MLWPRRTHTVTFRRSAGCGREDEREGRQRCYKRPILRDRDKDRDQTFGLDTIYECRNFGSSGPILKTS